VGVLVRFATVGRGTTHPSYAWPNHREPSRGRSPLIRESDSVSRTRDSIVHRSRRVPAHLANIDLSRRVRFFHLRPRSITINTLFVPPITFPSTTSTFSSLRTLCLPITLTHPRVLPQPPSAPPITLENSPPRPVRPTRSQHLHTASTAACLQTRISHWRPSTRKCQISASAMLQTLEIEIRRRYMSRIAEPVLTTSTWMLVKNIFSAELVRLPLPQDLHSPPGIVFQVLYYSSPLHIIYRSIWLTWT